MNAISAKQRLEKRAKLRLISKELEPAKNILMGILCRLYNLDARKSAGALTKIMMLIDRFQRGLQGPNYTEG